jgi:acetyl esterase/lipase
MDKEGLDTPSGAPPTPGEKVVYCLHGGSYTQLSANPRDMTAGIAKGLLQHIPSVKRTFSIEYRLASAAPFPAENPFPTALMDALAGYVYLVRIVGFSPENIILEGDSAGGNLALALTRYLLEARKDIPDLAGLPCGLILNSPWADISPSHDTLESSSTKFKPYDYLMRPPAGSGYVYYPARALTGPHGLGAASTNPYISSASKDLPDVSFFGFPPTFITCGGIELLRDQIHTLRDRMTRDLGKENVSYFEAPDSVHDYLIFDFQEPERGQTLQAIAEWVEDL